QIRRKADPGICLSALQALEGAVRGVRWHSLPSEVKQDLKAFYRAETEK
ncbi:MAG: TfoX/Sxy family DNA transformation protein, partial [Clostridiales bacterium]|nr:TfoX/Sxy family DNA transformation protein [Clostridiales bacterium]